MNCTQLYTRFIPTDDDLYNLFIHEQEIVQSTITRWHKTPDLLTTLVTILPQDVHQRCLSPKKCINVSLGYRSYMQRFYTVHV